MVSTQDSESCDPSSSLGRTSFYLTYVHIFLHFCIAFFNCIISVAPITDICVLNANEKEQVPGGYIIVSKTVNGNPADLNHGSFNAPCMYICFK